jgi:hypothetical protein
MESLLKPREEATPVTDAAPSPAKSINRDAALNPTTQTETAPDAKAPAIGELEKDQSVIETPEGPLESTGVRPVSCNAAPANTSHVRHIDMPANGKCTSDLDAPADTPAMVPMGSISIARQMGIKLQMRSLLRLSTLWIIKLQMRSMLRISIARKMRPMGPIPLLTKPPSRRM